ncbi:MAG TPA: hypothetical protein H9889_06385 [Candidatus Ignatzschineria merdigallinarum]|uniref:Uncharacterized protein n=1 Tax=Candidatus Ignatzschineria merdigallinarum TaxID=2838621 RepID=A0A9D1Q695_9GAMM|nr:hypothetical protein [Candidatus Ignatzschineria merdigallinarum]
MKQRISDQNLISFYQNISQYQSFKEIACFQSKNGFALNSELIPDKALYSFIKNNIQSLKEVGIEGLLQYRMHVYQYKSIETIPILKRLDLSFEVIENLGSIERVQQALLNLIDYAIYSIAIHDASHEAINEIREYIFTLEDYCLQIEHTKDLRERCQSGNETSPDTLQIKLEEDLQKMSKYLKQIQAINDFLLQAMRKAS